MFYSLVFHHGQSGSKIAPLPVPCSWFWVVEAILLFITLPCLVEFDELSGKTRCRLCFIAYWYIILSVNSFYSKLSFDFWCLPRDLTRIIKLIYSHIRNWSLNWWIFKAIKVQHELINTMRDTMRLWLLPDDRGKGLRTTSWAQWRQEAPDVNSQNTINRIDGWARVISWLSRSKTQSTIVNYENMIQQIISEIKIKLPDSHSPVLNSRSIHLCSK